MPLTTALFKNCNILKFADSINESCIFINNCFNKNCFSIFYGKFKLILTTHSYIRLVRNIILFAPSYNSVRFGGKLSIAYCPFNHSYMKLSPGQAN